MNRLGRVVSMVGRVVLVVAPIGFVIGCGVAGLQYLVIEVLIAEVRGLSFAAMAVAPVIGVLITAAVLRWSVPGADASTTDDLFRGVSGRRSIDLWAVPGRAIGLVATTGSGAAMAIDGSAAYLGGAVGVATSRWMPRLRIDAESMVVAGSAAAFSAVFQQPVFGVLFTLEAPYRSGLDARRSVPAAVGAIAGYAGFRLCLDTAPVFTIVGLDVDARLVIAAVIAGVVGGAVARMFGLMMIQARDLTLSLVMPVRLAAAAAVLMMTFLASSIVDTDGLTLGPGGATLGWALDPDRATILVLAIVILRLLSTSAVIVGGGVGGALIPLVTAAAITGRAIAGPVASEQMLTVAALTGAAALTAAYRVPLAGFAFAVTSLGSLTGVLPAALCIAAAMAVSPGVAVTTAQRPSPRPTTSAPSPPASSQRPDVERSPRRAAATRSGEAEQTEAVSHSWDRDDTDDEWGGEWRDSDWQDP